MHIQKNLTNQAPGMAGTAPPKALASGNGKQLGLDFMRVVLSFGVIVFHYYFFSYITTTPVRFEPERLPFYQQLYFFYNYGGEYRIPAFWCLSGFLYFWKYGAKIADGRAEASDFFMLRLSRLYPLHLLTMFIVMGLQMLYREVNGGNFIFYNDLKHFVLQLFFASDWGFEDGHSFNGPIWSLSVEVLVYVIFFLTTRFLGKSVYVNLLVLLVCLLLKKIFHFESSIIHCAACFYAGGIAAQAYIKAEKQEYRKTLFSIALVLAVLLPLATWQFELYRARHFSEIFVILYAPVIIFLAVRDFHVHPTIRNVIETFGNMIYSTYLVHFPLMLLITLCCTYMGIRVPMYSTAFFVGYMTLVFSSAYLLWYNFERPVQSAIRKWWKEVGTATTGAVASLEKVTD